MDKYKDLPEIIADMLTKQDQTIDAVNRNNEKIETTNNILKNFTQVSVKPWEQ